MLSIHNKKFTSFFVKTINYNNDASYIFWNGVIVGFISQFFFQNQYIYIHKLHVYILGWERE